MKFTAILLFAACLQVSATGFSQKITLSQDNVSLRQVFKEIGNQSGYQFFYKDRLIRQAENVSIHVTNATIEEALDQCLKSQPLSYSILDKIIVVKAKPNLPVAIQVSAILPPVPLNIITGTVKDEKGNPLAGVSVVLKGTNKGTSTDVNGRFSIDANIGEELEFSFVGYQKKNVIIGQNNNLAVIMEIEATVGNEVVIIGYGTQKKSDLTGSVSTVNSENFNKGVQTNALQLLTGAAAGVQVSQASSAPGGALSIKIRGAGSINSSNAPLIVIDGLPGADPSSIDPNDIKSIDVLKDASASAIYGTRAANGVVLITTKKGGKNMPSISYNGYFGVQSAAKLLNVLNATQYMQMVDTVTNGNNLAMPYTASQIAAAGTGTDWQKEIYRNAMVQNHSLSFSGASDKSNYYLGLNYFNQDGIVLTSNLQKYGVRFNFEAHPIQRLKINFNIEAQKGINNSILTTNAANESAGPINSAIEFDPSVKVGIDSTTGQYYTNPSVALNNPLALLYGVTTTTTNNRSYGTLSAEYSIFNGLTATLRLGDDNIDYRTNSYTSRLTINGGSTNGSASVNYGGSNHWIAEYFMTYNKTFNKLHHLTIVGGSTFENTNTKYVISQASGFPSDILGVNVLQSGLQSTYQLNSSIGQNRLNSFLGRLNYSYNDKYLLTASARADGTSVFSDQHKYAVFPSIALGWRIINESFMNKDGILSDLKLRASYGTIGNQAIPSYQTLTTFASSGTTVLGSQVVTGVEPTRIPNPDLKWETTAETNIGLDFGFFNQRITGSVEYFHKNTYDQLFYKPLPASTGFANQLVNFGSAVNKGLDFLLSSQNISHKLFKWRTTLTISTLKNVVTQLPDFVPTPILGGTIGTFNSQYTEVNVGYPMYAFYGYKVAGVFQQGDNIAASAQPNAHPGDLKFFDRNGNGKIDAGDRMMLGNPFPKYVIGFNNNFSYKGFNLSVMVNAVEGVSTLDVNTLESLYPINTYRNRYSDVWLNRWTDQNPTNKYPSLINPANYGGALSVNSLDVVDASYIRVQNVTLSYLFSFKNKHSLKTLSVYAAGDNLLTITKFKGYDPDANDSYVGNSSTLEKANYNSYPLGRVFRFGVSMGF